MGMVDTDFEEKIKKNSDMHPQDVWFSLFRPPCIYWGSILVGHTVVLKMVYFLGIEYSCCLICTLCSLTPKRLLWARTLDPDVLCYFYSSLKKRTKNRGWSTSCYVIRFRYPKRHNKNLCGPYLYLWSRNILFFDNFSKVANFPW